MTFGSYADVIEPGTIRRVGVLFPPMNRRDPTPSIYMNYEQNTLKNGIRLLTTYMPGMRSASIAFFFTVGSRYEPDQIAGVSHFIEHMLFKGSQRYPTARLISEAIEGVGGTFNGSTGKELTSYTARVPNEYLPEVMNVLADMVRNSFFDPAEIEKERSVIIEELSSTQDDPQEWVNLLIDEVMWPGLPLGRDDAGSIQTVSQLQRHQMQNYMDAHYRPNSFVISVAGNIDHKQVFQLTENLFNDWEAGKPQSWTESLPPRNVAPVRMIKKATEQTNICLATLGSAYTSPDYYPLLLINALLGDGMSSRLFQSLREEQGLAYDIGSYLNSYYETGNLVVSAGWIHHILRKLYVLSLLNSHGCVMSLCQMMSLSEAKPMSEGVFYWVWKARSRWLFGWEVRSVYINAYGVPMRC